MSSRAIAACLFAAACAVIAPEPAAAQITDRLRRAARNAVGDEMAQQVDRLLRNAVRCVFDDVKCVESARRDGKDVVLTDDDGTVLTDDDGHPITDPADVREPPRATPGEGAWANYDFVPGEDVLYYEDYANDNVGDFPRRMAFIKGNWEIVEWQGRRLLRNTGPRGSAVAIQLPRTLPEQFTIELEAHFPGTNQQMVLATVQPDAGRNYASLPGNFFQIASNQGTGVTARGREAVRSLNRTDGIAEELMPVRIMVDGSYAKVYVDERRVANVPNADLQRSDVIYLENSYSASDRNPMLIGAIRIAAGGRDLYDVLAEEGRVATRGILFATGSARIRPESTPTLKEIAAMLGDHPALRLSIEGHTDDVGDDATNLTLSTERAAAVRQYLIDNHAIDGARLETEGFGESRPAVSNTTPEARQQNRRVELVRLDG